ncbi:MAG: hypothetical protein R3F07_11185 [Opitutaceae bacterium]
MPHSSPHRFLFDNDGHNFVATLTSDLEGDIQELISECPPAVTTYLFCPGAGTYYYPTAIGAVDTRRIKLLEYHRKGIDPMGLALEALRAAGKEVFLTFRMNDVHNPTDTDNWNTPIIRRKYPEMIVDPEGAKDPKADWMCWCLDYSRPEIRDYIISIFEEMADRYPIDGFQLDWLRFPRHLPGNPETVWSLRHHLTSVVRDAHRIFSARGARVAVRVPTSLEGCRHLGLDIGEWAREGLIDMITACPFLTTDFTMPIDALREAMKPAAVPVYAGFDFAHGWQIHSPESLRAASSSLYACGADGIYLFNFPCWAQYTVSRNETLVEGIENPETACRKPLLFSLPITHHIRKDIIDGPGVLPVEIGAGKETGLNLWLPPKALPAARALLHLVGPGDFTLEVNGTTATELPDRRQREIFPWPTGDTGWFAEFSFKAANCRVFRIVPGTLRAGDNALTFTNRGSTPAPIRRLNLGLM